MYSERLPLSDNLSEPRQLYRVRILPCWPHFSPTLQPENVCLPPASIAAQGPITTKAQTHLRQNALSYSQMVIATPTGEECLAGEICAKAVPHDVV